jgi:septal ring factor EnvC (AmiA/AmiB activator)
MTCPTVTTSLVAQRVVLSVLAVMFLAETGCVNRHTHDRVKAETLVQTQALEAVREDLRELDRVIAELQAANRHEDATTAELRATIQREEEQLPIMRQRAEDTLASLKTQVATLMNQSWHLARKIADIRHESASLQTRVAQYKEEIEQARTPMMVASERETPVISEVSTPSVASTQEAELTQVAQAALPPPSPGPVKPSVPSPSVKADPPSANESWIDSIIGWFVKIWNWLLS